MWGGARRPVGARRRAELKRCGSAAARFRLCADSVTALFDVGLICSISYVYLQHALPLRVINEAPTTFRDASSPRSLAWPLCIISLGKLRWALGEVVGVALSSPRHQAGLLVRHKPLACCEFRAKPGRSKLCI